MKAIIKDQDLIQLAQLALQLGRQGTGDKNDKNCVSSVFDRVGGQRCHNTKGREGKAERGYRFGEIVIYFCGKAFLPVQAIWLKCHCQYLIMGDPNVFILIF
jgi:hypothetical protein